jgi:hypothetical protein
MALRPEFRRILSARNRRVIEVGQIASDIAVALPMLYPSQGAVIENYDIRMHRHVPVSETGGRSGLAQGHELRIHGLRERA